MLEKLFVKIMQGHHLVIEPATIDMYDTDEVAFETQMRCWMARVKKLSLMLEPFLQHAFAEDARDADPRAIEMASKELQEFVAHHVELWRVDMVANMAMGREVRREELDKDHFGADERGVARKVRYMLNMHVFAELCRMKILLARPGLYRERRNLNHFARDELTCGDYETLYSLKRTTHTMWVEVVQTYGAQAEAEGDDIDESERMAQDMMEQINTMWKCPILEYTQSNVRSLVMFLSQQINQLETRSAIAVREFRTVFRLLWVRIAELCAELHSAEVLDDPDMRTANIADPGDGTQLYGYNRDFLAFCTIYMCEMERRIFHYECLHGNKIHGLPGNTSELGERAFAWIERVVMMIPDDSMDTILESIADDGYHYVGDDEWFEYQRGPDEVYSRGACITKFRPHLYKTYFSEEQLNRRTMLINARTKHPARLFIMHVVDEQLRSVVADFHWMNGVRVDSDGIEQTRWKLTEATSPMLIQTLSSYWAYDSGCVHVCDDIYETLGVWFWLARARYGGVLHGFNLNAVLDEVLNADPRGVPAAAAVAVPQQRGQEPIFEI